MGDNDPTDLFSSALAPYIEALFPVAAGTVAHFSKSGVNMGDLDGDSQNETATLNLDVSIVAFEPLDTQLGSFARTVHSMEMVSGEVTVSSNGSKVPFTSTQNLWSAPNVGIIKRALSTTIQSTTQEDTFEARGYVVDGVGHGLSAPLSILPDLAPASSDIYNPGRASLACDGTNCLVMSSSSGGVIGTLLDAKGASLASVNLGPAGRTATVFDSTNYLVVVSSGTDLRAHRVTTAGGNLDGTAGNVLAAGLTPGEFPAAASGSANTLVVYTKFDLTLNQHLLYGLLVDRNGQPVAPGEFAIALDNSTHLFPGVAFDGANYLVVWQQQPSSGADTSTLDIYGVRVSQSGAVLDATPIVVSGTVNGQFSPSIAFDGANYLIVWLDSRNQPASTQPCGVCDIYGARVTTGGAVLDPAGIAISTGGTQPRSDFPSVAFNGTEYLVVWAMTGYASTGSTGIRLARVSTDGIVTSTPVGGIAISGAPSVDTVSQYALPVIAPNHRTSPGACIVWLDNAEVSGAQKQLLAVTSHGF
jgi:hypothetical protein